MSAHFKGLVVTLDDSYKEEDLERVIAAIKLLRGIVEVTPVQDNFDDNINRARVRHELVKQLFDVLSDGSKKPRPG